MDNYVAPEVFDYAKQIVKNVVGAKAVLKSVEWSAGGLYNKVYYVNTDQGEFILKVECDQIFTTIRRGQIENEVYASKLLRGAGIPCAPVLSYDFTREEIGKRFVFSQRISNDLLFLYWDTLTDINKEDIRTEIAEILKQINNITNSHFGSICESGILGRHKTWKEYYNHMIQLLIQDCERLYLLTKDELQLVKAAAQKVIESSNLLYTPTFNHGDFGGHNAIWGSLEESKNKVHIIDFGNAAFGLPAYDEYVVMKHGDFGFEKDDLGKINALDKSAYENTFLNDLENVLFVATMKTTMDYAHCTNGLAQSILRAKADTSRNYITDFVDKCKMLL